MTTDDRPQHLQALARANEIRWARAALKRGVASGLLSVAEVIDPESEIPAEAESMPIMELLEAQKHWGRARCQKLLGPLQIGEQRQLDALTLRQRGELLVALGGAEAGEGRPLAA